MLNTVQLQGTIVSTRDETKPTIRGISSKDGAQVLGYAARLRFETGTGIGYVNVVHWSPTSALSAAKDGSLVRLEGALDVNGWMTTSGESRYELQIRAESLSCGSE